MGYGLPNLDMPVWVWWRAFLENCDSDVIHNINRSKERNLHACLEGLGSLGLLGGAGRLGRHKIIDPRSIRDHIP